MKHPFETLKPEYSQLLSLMTVRPECQERINEVAVKILGFRDRFEKVQQANGVPVIFTGPSFYREASLDFNLSPAQGDPWRKVSVHVPENRGPFRSWLDAAIDAYHINGLDKVGASNWTWELVCFYAELFNGLGYRDFHHMHSPYLWGGTNIQTKGKYTSDGHFEDVMDEQLGVIPLARKIVEIAPDLAPAVAIPAPMPSGIAAPDTGVDVKWVQGALKELGWNVAVDGSYGRETRRAVERFQFAYRLDMDGLAGPKTIEALKIAVSALEHKDAP